jgi:hypothetical protein
LPADPAHFSGSAIRLANVGKKAFFQIYTKYLAMPLLLSIDRVIPAVAIFFSKNQTQSRFAASFPGGYFFPARLNWQRLPDM